MFPAFIMSRNGLTLWQINHYHYEIARCSGDRFQLLETVNDSCEVAVQVLQSLSS